MADKKPDNSLSDTLQSLRDVLARFPDVVAASLSNAFSRSPVPAADGVSQAQDPGLFRSAAQVFEPLMRRFARQEEPAPFSPTRFTPSHSDFGKVDWSAILAPQKTPLPGGPATSFDRGDVMAEVRERRRERIDAAEAAAARAQMWGGGFSSRPAVPPGLAATAFDRTVIAHGPRGPRNFPDSPDQPGRFTRVWADISASWRSMAADFRYFAKHPGTVFSGFGQGMSGAARRAFSATGAAAQAMTGGGGWPGGINPWRRAAVHFGRHYRAAGGGRGPLGRMFRGHRNLGRRARRAHGAWKKAGAAGGLGGLFGRAGMVAGSLGTAVQAITQAVAAMKQFAEMQVDSNRRFASVNPHAAHAYAQLGIGDFHRTVQTGRENEGTIAKLARTVDSMRDAFRPLDSLGTALGNRAAIAASNVTGSFMRLLNPSIEWIRGAAERLDPNADATGGVVNWVGRQAHGAWGAASSLLNTASFGWLGTGTGNFMKDAAAASQKEYDEQVKAARGSSDEVFNSLVKMGWPEQRVFLPPRKVVRP